ncbi:MAG: hypothetical protein QXU32_01550 [Nitrososphaerales archaeon]
MAGIIWNKGEESVIRAWLSGQSDFGSPRIIPPVGGSWGVGLGTRSGGVGGNKADTITQINEVGRITANGYGRAVITRDTTGSGWPAPSLVSGSMASTSPQVAFNFTGAPDPNGATLWFIAGNTTINADNALFGADTAAVRTFGNGDVERVTATFRQT